jgi:hypothetical protein
LIAQAGSRIAGAARQNDRSSGPPSRVRNPLVVTIAIMMSVLIIPFGSACALVEVLVGCIDLLGGKIIASLTGCC